MKKILFGIKLISFTALLGACTDSLSVGELSSSNDVGAHAVKVAAQYGDKRMTRTYVSESGKFSWQPGDKISVYTTTGSFYTLEIDGSEATTDATFSGSVSGTQTTYAVSPDNLNPKVSNEGLTLTLPSNISSQNMRTDAPMVAQYEEGEEKMMFKNVAGLMRVYVANIPAGRYTITATADNQQLSGDFLLAEQDGYLQMNAAASTDKNVVTISYENSESGVLDKRAFFIPLPVGEYKNLKVEMTSEDGTWFSKKAKQFTIARSQMIIMPTFTCGATPETNQQVITSSETIAEDLNNKLEEIAQSQMSTDQSADINITIAASPEESGTVEEDLVQTVNISEDLVIPQNITRGSTSVSVEEAPAVILTFDAVPTSTKTMTVGDETVGNIISVTDNQEVQEEASQSLSEVQITIPSVVAENVEEQQNMPEAPSFNINLPTSTVTLSATGESALYNVVISNTAANTLRVDKGVTIKKLIVGVGNVLLRGEIESVENLSELPIYITLEPGSKIDLSKVPSNIIIIDHRSPINNGMASNFANESIADGINTPYAISTLSELLLLADRVNGGMFNADRVPYYKCNYKLTSSIDLDSLGTTPWDPIGSWGAPFRGSFDGLNNAISGNNIKIKSGVLRAGIFGHLESATVKNLEVKGHIYFEAVDQNMLSTIGGIAGYIEKGTVLENCTNYADIDAKIIGLDVYAAGIVGQNDEYSGRNRYIACGNYGHIKIEPDIDHGRYGSYAGIVCDPGACDIIACYNVIPYSNFIGWTKGDNVIISCWGRSFNWNICPSDKVYNCCYSESAVPTGGMVINKAELPDSCFIPDPKNPIKLPTSAIDILNAGCSSLGWMYNNSGKPTRTTTTGIPSIFIREW